jgi:hypothetical protein
LFAFNSETVKALGAILIVAGMNKGVDVDLAVGAMLIRLSISRKSGHRFSEKERLS